MSPDAFTKLFGTIITSSIWSEDDKTRIMWITLLACADADGYCAGSVVGFAAMARMSFDDATKAIERLEAPDPHSRTPDHEGRRVLKVDGGWLLINHAKYREKAKADERREYLRLKKAEQRRREHQPTSTSVNNVSTSPSASVSVLSGEGMQGERALECNTTPVPESEFRQRLRALYGRRPSTMWSDKELRVLKLVETSPDALEDMALVESHYAAMKKGPKDKDYHRRNVETLLNHWNGAVDTARNFRPPPSNLL